MSLKTWTFSNKGKKLSSLSNQWPCRVVIQTREYKSGEQALRGEKYTRLGQHCADPVRAKQLFDAAACDCEIPLTPEEMTLWSEWSVDVQTDICRWKAAHCREVQEDLFSSGTKPLIYLNKREVGGFWGGSYRVDPVSGEIHVIGGNMLGYIWMDVRADRVALLEWGAETYCD